MLFRFRVTRLKAAVLREKWTKEAHPSCPHFTLRLEQTDKGYLREPIFVPSAGR